MFERENICHTHAVCIHLKPMYFHFRRCIYPFLFHFWREMEVIWILMDLFLSLSRRHVASLSPTPDTTSSLTSTSRQGKNEEKSYNYSPFPGSKIAKLRKNSKFLRSLTKPPNLVELPGGKRSSRLTPSCTFLFLLSRLRCRHSPLLPHTSERQTTRERPFSKI